MLTDNAAHIFLLYKKMTIAAWLKPIQIWGLCRRMYLASHSLSKNIVRNGNNSPPKQYPMRDLKPSCDNGILIRGSLLSWWIKSGSLQVRNQEAMYFHSPFLLQNVIVSYPRAHLNQRQYCTPPQLPCPQIPSHWFG